MFLKYTDSQYINFDHLLLSSRLLKSVFCWNTFVLFEEIGRRGHRVIQWSLPRGFPTAFCHFHGLTPSKKRLDQGSNSIEEAAWTYSVKCTLQLWQGDQVPLCRRPPRHRACTESCNVPTKFSLGHSNSLVHVQASQSEHQTLFNWHTQTAHYD